MFYFQSHASGLAGGRKRRASSLSLRAERVSEPRVAKCSEIFVLFAEGPMSPQLSPHSTHAFIHAIHSHSRYPFTLRIHLLLACSCLFVRSVREGVCSPTCATLAACTPHRPLLFVLCGVKWLVAFLRFTHRRPSPRRCKPAALRRLGFARFPRATFNLVALPWSQRSTVV